MDNPEIGSFDDIVEVEYVKFAGGEVQVTFTSSEFLIDRNAYGNRTYTFAVVEAGIDKLLGITSKRLMLRLKEHNPLEGKTFTIERIGRDMDTDYNVSEVSE